FLSGKIIKNSRTRFLKLSLSVQAEQFGFWVFPDANLVESVESSAVSKSLVTNKFRYFNAVGCSTRKVWFHKGCISAESVLSLSRILNRDQLNLDRFKFGSQLHSFECWPCVCSMHLRKMTSKQMC
ncbi:DUF645 family protein, partial [Vibrio cholerae]|nr:DUF645 family protein [Vibrio cholerae]